MNEKDTQPINLIILYKNTSKAFKYLLSQYLTILIISVVFGLIGITYAWLKKPAFVAELVFSAETGSDNVLSGYSGLAAQFGFDLGGGSGGAFEGDNLMELLRSWRIIKATLLSEAPGAGGDKLMIDKYIENHEIDKYWFKDSVLKKIKFEKSLLNEDRARDSVLKAVYKKIILDQLDISKKDKKLNYITVKVKDVNEEFSRRFVTILIDNASRYYVEYKSKKARKNYELVSRLTDSVKALVYGNITSYAVSNDLNVNPIRQVVRANTQRIQLNTQANSALYTELLKQLGISQITLLKETPLIQIIDEPSLPLKKEKPGRLLTGIVFSIIGAILTVLYLLFSRWIRTNITRNSDN
jgi:hypothetical protein